MNHSEETPKLPVFPFVVGDLVLIATAFFIGYRSASPITPVPLLAISVCVIVGSALAVIPFLANYARRQDAELTDRQNQIAALARTTADSAEQLGIVAAGLNGIAESSKHHLDALGQLPAKLQERIETLAKQIDGAATAAHATVKADVAQLEAAAENLSRSLARLESATKAKTDQLGSLEKDLAAALARAAAQLDAFVATAATTTARLAELPPPPAPAPTPASAPAPGKSRHVTVIEEVTPSAATPAPVDAAVEPAPTPPPAPEPVVEQPAPPVEPPAPEPAAAIEEPAFTPAEPEAADVPVSDPETPKPVRARKPRPSDDGFDLGLTPETPEAAESSVSSDGFTRLIATAYIGIGNKLYIRGEGPGLSWEKGIPLQFVSIGKWRWETPDATAPVSVKLYKNDQIECHGLGALTLEPGRQHEVNAGF